MHTSQRQGIPSLDMTVGGGPQSKKLRVVVVINNRVLERQFVELGVHEVQNHVGTGNWRAVKCDSELAIPVHATVLSSMTLTR